MKFMQVSRACRFRSSIASVLLGMLLVAGVSGCGATYGPKASIWGRSGYVESKLDETTWQVNYQSTEDMETAERYLIFRCAEITVANGFDYFITSNQTTSSSRRAKTDVSMATSDYVASARIALFKGRKPEGAPAVLDAHQVLENLGPTIKR